MCGIAGFLGIREEGLIEKMLRVMRYRGPDASNHWIDQDLPVAIGHNRLSILDLSDFGKQPMWDESKRFCITYNGEIYNYRKLRNELEAKGYRFRSGSDTEVLLNLFSEKGSSCLKELNGIWAFAIWDTKEKKLFASRDPLGVKPFYFAVQKDKFLFASEIKSILCWNDFSKNIDRAAIYETLTYLWTPGPRTLFSNIRKLCPGQTITVRLGKPPEIRDACEIRPSMNLDGENEDEIVELLQDNLYRSVQSQLVSDVPVGAFLSGGLDSSAVVAMAERNGKRISCCYTIDYAGGRDWEGMANDLQYARKVASHLGVECIEIKLEISILHRVREMIWHLEEPQSDLAPLNVLLIAEAARKNGDYVMLSGAGGDDIFSGYRRHVALHSERWWGWLPHLLRLGLKSLSDIVPPSNPYIRRFKRMFRDADQKNNERLIRYFAWAPQRKILNLFHEDIQKEFYEYDPYSVMRDALKRFNDPDPLNKMLFLDTRFFLADHNLNYTDKMGMAKGIEIRVPLIDINLVKLALSIPSALKLKGVTGKYIFKRAMEPFLPNDVIYRPKTGFVAPVREWMLGPLHDQVGTTLSKGSLERRGWFSYKAVQGLFDDLKQNRDDIQYLLLSVYMIEEWARMFIDGDNINP